MFISGNYFEACGLCGLLENGLNIIKNNKYKEITLQNYKNILNKLIENRMKQKYDLILEMSY